MTTQYTTILKLALPVQGELSGTWGDVVNDNITQMVEQAIAGKATVNSWTANSHTLTTADGTTSESRCAILELTDSGTALTGAGTVVCPTNTKLYIVDNNTAEIVTVKTSGGTGVAVPVGKTMLVYCDGTNVVEGVTHANSLSLGTSTSTVNAIDTATDLGAGSSSNSNLPTQLAVKTYVDGQIAATNELSEVLAAGNVTGANDIDVENAQKVQFRDTAIYINSSVDGQLDIAADGEVQIDTALVDINGNLDVSGTANIGGPISFTKNAIAGVAISTIARASNTVTVTNSAVHGLTNGDLVNINGVANRSFNGYFTVSVSSTTVFTYNQTGVDESSTGGTSTEVVYNINASGTGLNQMNGPLNIAANSAIDGLEITQSGSGEALSITGGNALFGDNDKAIFGAGSDLQIYHDGSASFISDQGTGHLKLLAGDFRLNNAADNAQLISAVTGAEVNLFYNNALKLATTASGVHLGANSVNATLSTESAGTSNLTLGVNAGNSIVSGGNYNTVVGDEAGTAINTGDNNSFFGYQAGDAINTGSNNTVMGYSAYSAATSGVQNTVIGAQAAEAYTGNYSVMLGQAAGQLSTTGGSLVLIGQGAGRNKTTGNYSIHIGESSGFGATSGLNNTGANNISVGGISQYQITSGFENVAVGHQAQRLMTSGSHNVGIGPSALYSCSTGTYNTVVGSAAGLNISTGTNNTLIGGLAGDAIDTASQNTALGYSALSTTTTGAANTAVGFEALQFNTTASNNTGIGWRALYSNDTGTSNVAVGVSAALNNQTGSDNSAFGHQAMQFNTTGGSNSAFGRYALLNNLTASFNTAVGRSALQETTTGANNVGVGYRALYLNETASNNTAVGYNALSAVTSGSNNIAIGFEAGDKITTPTGNIAIGIRAVGYAGAAMTGQQDVGIGDNVLYSVTTGSYNVALGGQALYSNSTASNNTAVGYQAGYTNSTGTENTFIGMQAGYAVSGSYNYFSGYRAGYNVTTGTINVGVGRLALGGASSAGVSGSENVAVGNASLYVNESGAENAVLGTESLRFNTSGSKNVAVGQKALFSNISASLNTAVGYQTGYNTSTGDNNTFVGEKAGYNNTTADRSSYYGSLAGNNTTGRANTFIGCDAGYLVTTGTKNTILGRYSGNQVGLDIRTASNNIVLSDGDGNPRAYFNNTFNTWSVGNSGVGRLCASQDQTISVADGGTVTLTNQEAGAMMIHVYDTGSGDGAVFFANYQGTTTVIHAEPSANFSTTDSAGDFCVFKSASNHTVTFKNNTGVTRNMSILIVGARTRST